MQLLEILANDDVERLEEFIHEVDDPNFRIKIKQDDKKLQLDKILLNEPPLISISAFYGSVKCFSFLHLSEADLNEKDKEGRLVTHFASAGGCIEICDTLDSCGLDFLETDFYKRNSLHYACQYGRLQIVERLWMRNFNLNEPDNDGLLPIHYSALAANSDVIDFLVSNGCDLAKSVNGITPFRNALNNSPEVLKYLLKANKNSKFLDDNTFTSFIEEDRTPLTNAIYQKNPEITKVLLENTNSDINQQDELGWTPLLHAASNGLFEICEILIDHGADVNKPSFHGFTPLHAAKNRGYDDIYELIKKNNGRLQ